MSQSRRYTFQKDHEGVPTCGAAHLAEWTEAELIDALVKELIKARRMVMQALMVYAERVELKSGRTGSFDMKDTIERPRDFVAATEASAIGDNVKVPPHWHVRLSFQSAKSDGPLKYVIPRGSTIQITDDSQTQTAQTGDLAYESSGLIVVDVVLSSRPRGMTAVTLVTPMGGVSARGDIISIT